MGGGESSPFLDLLVPFAYSSRVVAFPLIGVCYAFILWYAIHGTVSDRAAMASGRDSWERTGSAGPLARRDYLQMRQEPRVEMALQQSRVVTR